MNTRTDTKRLPEEQEKGIRQKEKTGLKTEQKAGWRRMTARTL